MAIAEDVSNFLDECAKKLGKQEEDAFHQRTFCEYADLKIESPIEQLFYTAFKAALKLCCYPKHDADILNGKPCVYGMEITPQCRIQTYRVDFYIAWHGFFPSETGCLKKVVVECDSQEWHERSERERRYEKRRDRELARLGLHTFRFTGKEIKENPVKVAAEVLAYLCDDGTVGTAADIETIELLATSEE